MNSPSYDNLINQLIYELNHEFPNVLKLNSIIEESDCPYLERFISTKAKALDNKLSSKKTKI